MGKSITVADKKLGGTTTQNSLSNTTRFLLELQTQELQTPNPQTAGQPFRDPESPERMLAVDCACFLKKDTGRRNEFLRKQKELRQWIDKQSQTYSFPEWTSWCYSGGMSGSEAKLAIEAAAVLVSF